MSLITVVALLMALTSIFPSIAIAAVRISNAVDIANIPAPALPAFLPATKLAIMTSANDSNILFMEARLFSIVTESNFSKSLNAVSNILRDTTSDNNVPAAPHFTLPHTRITTTNNPIILAMDSTFVFTLSALSLSMVARASTTILILAARATIVIEPFDNCGTFAPSIPTRIAIAADKPAITNAFLTILSLLRLSRIFKAPAKANMAAPSVAITTATSLNEPFFIEPMVAITANNPVIVTISKLNAPTALPILS